jgi:glycosyltransferase involved in cell wall biosynthesis
MANPLISIIVPVLNEKEFIPQLLDSIILQTYRPIEVIFIDGGSRDGSRALLCQTVQAISNSSLSISLIYEEDYPGSSSPAHAKNIGIHVSSSEYIILIDADTKFKTEEAIVKLQKALDSYPFVIAQAEIQVDTQLEKSISYEYSRYYHIGYRRFIFNRVSFNETLGIGEDRDIWFRTKRDLKLDPYIINEDLLIRHLPHTKTEYLNQIKWYARTYNDFVNNLLKEGEFPYLSEAIATYTGCIVCFFVPLFLLFSISKDYLKNRLPANVIYLNVMRRYLFLFYLFLYSKRRPFIKNFSICLSIFMSNKLKRKKE